MKKLLIGLSAVSLLGLGTVTMEVSASDQGSNLVENNFENYNGNYQNRENRYCNNLTEEEKSLLEQGYKELTKEEKDLFDAYKKMHKRDLSEEQLNEYYKLCDKVHKYMSEEFKENIEEKREFHRERRLNNNGQERGYGKKSCR